MDVKFGWINISGKKYMEVTHKILKNEAKCCKIICKHIFQLLKHLFINFFLVKQAETQKKYLSIIYYEKFLKDIEFYMLSKKMEKEGQNLRISFLSYLTKPKTSSKGGKSQYGSCQKACHDTVAAVSAQTVPPPEPACNPGPRSSCSSQQLKASWVAYCRAKSWWHFSEHSDWTNWVTGELLVFANILLKQKQPRSTFYYMWDLTFSRRELFNSVYKRCSGNEEPWEINTCSPKK